MRILLTGAFGGIGRAIMHELRNHQLFVITSTEEKLHDLRQQHQAQDTLHGCVCDLSASSADIRHIVQQAVGIYGGIDAFVHCAGVTKDKLAIQMTDDDWDTVLNVNLKSAFTLATECIKHMSKQKYGRIVFITSVVGSMGNAGQANYCSSKAGLTGLAKALAREYGKRNILTNCIAPGFIETEMTAKLPETVVESMLKQIPMQRFGQPYDVAKCVRFLLEDADYINGTSIAVNGGMYM